MRKLWRWFAGKDSDLVSSKLVMPVHAGTRSVFARTAGRIQTALSLPGVNSNYASVPHAAALMPTSGVIRIEARIRMAVATTYHIGGKWAHTGDKRAYRLITLNDSLMFQRSSNGANTGSATSSVGHGIAAGAIKWIAGEWSIGDSTVDFELSDDGDDWTALGTQQTLATAPFSSDAVFGIGWGGPGATIPFNGRIYNCRMYHNGTLLLDADFTKGPVGANTLLDGTEDYTITVNSTGQAFL